MQSFTREACFLDGGDSSNLQDSATMNEVPEDAKGTGDRQVSLQQGLVRLLISKG